MTQIAKGEKEADFYERVREEFDMATVWAIPGVKDFDAHVPQAWQTLDYMALTRYVPPITTLDDPIGTLFRFKDANYVLIAMSVMIPSDPDTQCYSWWDLWNTVDTLSRLGQDIDHHFIEAFEVRELMGSKVLAPVMGS